MKRITLFLIISLFTICSYAQERPKLNPLEKRLNKIELVLKDKYPEIKDGQFEISIFSDKRCNHCKRFLKLLSKRNIPFIKFDVRIRKNANIMRKLCYKTAKKASIKIAYPVVLINNEVYYNTRNLRDFCNNIEKRYKKKK
ncbi:MAG: hypothetical protein WBG43_10320 [Marinifilaceae bacterium]